MCARKVEKRRIGGHRAVWDGMKSLEDIIDKFIMAVDTKLTRLCCEAVCNLGRV